MLRGGMPVAALSGALIGLGVALAIWRVVPADPDLADALDRLSATRPRRPADPTTAGAVDGRERLGVWAQKHLPRLLWAATPTRDLAVLRVSSARFHGEKLLYGVLGLAIAPALTGFFTLLGFPLPGVVPVAATAALAAVMFMLPDYNARDNAQKARADFTRALGAYIDLVALERNGGSGPRQALEVAASVGDSWVFHRLAEELARSSWSGQPPWEALHALAEQLGLPELADLADIMRLAGDEDAHIYSQLRARSASLRSAMLSTELAKASQVEDRMYIPASLLGVVFMGLLIAPSLLRLLFGDP